MRDPKAPKGFTAGVAAKLINVYLKATIVTAFPISALTGLTEADQDRIGFIHPPVDRLLLQTLAKRARSRFESVDPRWNAWGSQSWSTLSGSAYQHLIDQLRILANGKPLWMIEENWVGYQ